MADLPRPVRALTRVGFVLIFVMVGVLLAGDVLRASGALIPTFSGIAARGGTLPQLLFPLTLLMISISWAFLLAGAIHTHWALRSAVTVLYLALTVMWTGTAGGFVSIASSAVSYALLAAVVVVVVVRARGAPRPALEFALLFVLVAASYAFAQQYQIQAYRATGVPNALGSVDLMIALTRGLVTPLLILVGLDIADFLHRVSGWFVDLVTQQYHRAVVLALLGVGLAWRGYRVADETTVRLGEVTVPAAIVEYTGAAGIIGLVFAVWWLVQRRDADEPATLANLAHHAQGSIAKLAFAYYGWLLAASFLALTAMGVLAVAGVANGGALAQQILAGMQTVATSSSWWRVIFDIAVLVGAVWTYRRGIRPLAFYLGIVGATDLYTLLTSPAYPLSALGWESFAQVNALWTVLFLAVAIGWAWQGALTHERVRALLLVVAINLLLGPSELIDNPFSPFFAYAGVGFIAVGLLWDAITAGVWANHGTPRLPRTSRIFGYLGYVLLTATVVSWAVASHDLEGVAFYTGDAAAQGFSLFGQPLLYALFVLVLFPPRPDHAEEQRSGTISPSRHTAARDGEGE